MRPLADHAQGADLRPDRRHRRRAPPPRCPRRSAACATGTTATAGCATPPSPCTPCSAPATPRRPRPGATGCCARSPANPTSCRSCTGWRASGGCPSSELTGCRATRAPRRCGSATPPSTSSSSTCTARSSTRLHLGAPAGLARPRPHAWDLQLALIELPGGALARAGRGHLGGARPAPALRALQGHGLGRRRPGGARPSSSAELDGAARPLAATARRASTPRCARRASTPSATPSRSPTARAELDAALLLIPQRRLPAARRPARGRHRRGDRSAELCHDGFVLPLPHR